MQDGDDGTFPASTSAEQVWKLFTKFYNKMSFLVQIKFITED
jgi:hypothetical protein